MLVLQWRQEDQGRCAGLLKHYGSFACTFRMAGISRRRGYALQWCLVRNEEPRSHIIKMEVDS